MSPNQRYKQSGSTLSFADWITVENKKQNNHFNANGEGVKPADHSAKVTTVKYLGLSGYTWGAIAVGVIIVGYAWHKTNQKATA